MTLSPHVFDADNFNRLVLENSHKDPVLVDFWTPKAGSCFILMQQLNKRAADPDRNFRHDIARLSLLALFDPLGSSHSFTRHYRPALSESLH